MAYTLDGIILYEIFPDGCLNGVFSNDHWDGFIKDIVGNKIGNKKFNEIARKIDEVNNDILNKPSDLIGDYNCSYTDLGSVVCPCKLRISSGHIRKNGRACEYDFIWSDSSNNDIFEGSGWRFGNKIVVSYRDI